MVPPKKISSSSGAQPVKASRLFPGWVPSAAQSGKSPSPKTKTSLILNSSLSGISHDSKMRLAVQFEKHVHVVLGPFSSVRHSPSVSVSTDHVSGISAKTDVQILRCLALRRLKFQIGGFPCATAPKAGILAVVNGIRFLLGDVMTQLDVSSRASCAMQQKPAGKEALPL